MPPSNIAEKVNELSPSEHFNEKVDGLIKTMLEMPQVDCPVTHRFGPGVYIREIFIPAGTVAVGHVHRFSHMNVFLRGRVTVVNEDGSKTTLTAPMTFVGKPGRKIGYVHEDMLWQNVYATEERDIEKLEEMYLDKGDIWDEHKALKHNVALLQSDVDVDDYQSVLAEYGYTEEQVQQEVSVEADLIPFPDGSYKVAVSDSPIHGKGLFASAAIEAGEVIAPARLDGKRTPAGRYTNHSANPNATMRLEDSGDMSVVALKVIKGMKGGSLGEEVTIDYRIPLNIRMQEEEVMRCHQR